MIGSETDPMVDVAQAISSLFGDIGLAFVEDQHLDALADALRAFFETADIPINEERAAAYYGGLEDHAEPSLAELLLLRRLPPGAMHILGSICPLLAEPSSPHPAPVQSCAPDSTVPFGRSRRTWTELEPQPEPPPRKTSEPPCRPRCP